MQGSYITKGRNLEHFQYKEGVSELPESYAILLLNIYYQIKSDTYLLYKTHITKGGINEQFQYTGIYLVYQSIITTYSVVLVFCLMRSIKCALRIESSRDMTSLSFFPSFRR